MIETIKYIKKHFKGTPSVGIILGSGLGDIASILQGKVAIPYESIPNFNKTTIAGHKGQLLLGKVLKHKVAIMQGRFHIYEGRSVSEVIFPLRVLYNLGIRTLIITNAAGGINENYNIGDIVAISDHINLTGKNPLIGPNDSNLGPRFPDMGEIYCPKLLKLFSDVAKSIGYKFQTGVYAGMLGPSYETPAEIKMLKTIGADLVGMSTVLESIFANYLKISTLGISMVCNKAAGLSNEKLQHTDVENVSNQGIPTLINLITKFLEIL